MSASAEEVLDRLSSKVPVHVNSTATLVSDMAKAATASDRRRARKQTDREPSPRKRGLGPFESDDRRDLVAAPWDLLGVFARATTLARQGRGRGLAEHWQGLKYCQALGTSASGHLALTDEGQSPELSYRAMQARELGRAFGLAVAERTVRNRYPTHMVSVLDAEALLLAGFARSGPRPSLGARPRPDFFIEAWRPGEPSHVFVVTVNGNHQIAKQRTAKADRSSFKQLARGSERAEAFHLVDWNTTPSLLMATELLAGDGITVHALQGPGDGLIPTRSAEGRGSADAVLSERNLTYAGAVAVPASEGRRERIQDGFLIPRKDLGWYGRLLVRTGAAGQLAFAGAGTEIAQYLTDKQGHKHYQQQMFAGSSTVRDASHKIGSTTYVGTDQVFRLNRTRVEAFSGITEDLYELLVRGRVEECRVRMYDQRDSYSSSTTAPRWGPVSFRDDGSVMALRVL
ncbi:hypothetical protein [Streptomyces sp. NBC_01497]|uniref:hypothetical protein n=1 Tax=Streptomyces sp. NBC_01497 TaxID=2903885 RepID=UPI002E35CA35|nr:hypothetical protein [Streptomyces sp. NBC_01497]